MATAAPASVDFSKLQAAMRGPVVLPGDPFYEDARAVYNAMIDRRPAALARCVDAGDVITAVNFAREQGLLLAIRGGGHNGPGLGTCDDGLVVDLSLIKNVRVDPVARTARAGGGSTFGDIDHATHAFGMATPGGIISTTGMGLALGGGVGHLTRKCGLTIDNILEVDMVLADGSFVTASEKQHQDLFWAVRGGGGNFGVVTSLLFKLHPISTVYAGPMLWHLDKSEEVLRWYRDFLPSAPNDMNGFFAFLGVPPGPPFPEELHGKFMCGVVWGYTGPMDKAEEVFKPIRAKFGGPALDWVGPLPEPVLQSMFDPIYPPGDQWYWKADFFEELSDEAIRQHVKFGNMMPTGKSTMHLYPIDGAAADVSNDATPWAFRKSKWAQVMVGVSPDPADNPKMIQWTRDYWAALHPFSAGGAYTNMMMDAADEGSDRIKASYGANYQRLTEIKAKYDPNNLFSVNQNISPKAR